MHVGAPNGDKGPKGINVTKFSQRPIQTQAKSKLEISKGIGHNSLKVDEAIVLRYDCP